MKTIAIITIHRILNYGSVLQSYSLCKALQSMGHRPYVIDYVPGNHQFWHVLFGGKARHPWPVRIVLALLILPKCLLSRLRFDLFIRKFLPVSPLRYGSVSELRARPPVADVYMTGSDQVWNSGHNGRVDPAYYLDFGSQQTCRVSYAASFGREELPADEMPVTAKLVSAYHRTGVREASAVPLMAALGRPDAVQVVDPTLLLTGPEWLNVLGIVASSASAAGYVLLHTVNKDCLAELKSCAKQIAEDRGLRVISTTALSANLRGRVSSAILGGHRNTEDFVRLIAGAAVVVSDSFHGTVFSILLGRQFVTVLPPKYATRITSLLGMLGLEERIVQAAEAVAARARAPIDYAVVHARIDEERQRSLTFLRDSVD